MSVIAIRQSDKFREERRWRTEDLSEPSAKGKHEEKKKPDWIPGVQEF